MTRIGTNFDHDAMAGERAQVLEAFAVSRETITRLDRFVALLLEWQRVTNLVAPSTLPHLWSRHIADSLQLLDLVPPPMQKAKPGDGAKPWTWADLGSGAGFPGMVIACALAKAEGAAVHLVESKGRKAAFLREAAKQTGAAAVVHAERIEKIGPALRPKPDIITARALAPLEKLCHLIAPILKPGARALVMKGQHIDAELAEATKYWRIGHDLVPSRTDPSARIMILRDLARRQRPHEAMHGE